MNIYNSIKNTLNYWAGFSDVYVGNINRHTIFIKVRDDYLKGQLTSDGMYNYFEAIAKK
ncbi:MAG: hypothetical protein RLN62_05510 [Rickettsiales bacterium]